MIPGLLDIRDAFISQDHSRTLPQGPGVSSLAFQNVGVVERLEEVRDSLPIRCRGLSSATWGRSLPFS